ncbi:MAG: exonuclease, polymerase epsilon subunit family [Gemmatimonadetes bacterium]|nr:exonuclease, polymerase epsilon subunit family [Gemmatimonadota bacterium]
MTPGLLVDELIKVPSPSQRAAIEAEPRPLLVLAGPGAGKTYCLIERINYLIQHHGFDAARICAFTFTNKAAGEISHRLEHRLGAGQADRIQRGTIHAFCADLLRELGANVLLEPGFGIADEEYQLATLRRIEGPRRWHRNTLTRFSAHRFRGDPLLHDDLALFHQYEAFLTDRKLVDFDTLVIKAAELLEQSSVEAAEIRGRWDVILVDEFQDLNPVQYRVIRALATNHRHVFAVGDDEQSIYSWAGADPKVFGFFLNDFGLSNKLYLEENRRCPQDVFALARKLVMINTPIFADRVTPRADRVSVFPVQTIGFDDDDAEEAWIVNDIRRDREMHGHRWGDVALLYRTHDIGNRLEGAFLNAGIPCRLAQGRALADDPVVAYVLAASRVIAFPDDVNYRDGFLKVVLPRALHLEAQAEAERSQIELRIQLRRKALQLPRKDPGARTIRRALTEWKNLEAVGKQHTTLTGLITELLSRRVGKLRSVLDERHDEISDPATLPDVVRLAERLRRAREHHTPIWIAPMHGVDIPIKGMLVELGIRAVRGAPPAGAESLGPDDVRSIGLPLGVFKAAQLLEMSEISSTFTSFTAFDLETTDRDTARAEIVEIAAVRVRDGKIEEEFNQLVKPRVPLTSGAMEVHGITNEELADKPHFEEVWPAFRAFCGNDVIVAHNGYDFDFKIISRMAKEIGEKFDLCTYDSLPLSRELIATSNKLQNLARQFGIDAGQSHRALDDTRALAKVLLELNTMKLARARKTALVDLLGHLGVALALSGDDDLWQEALIFRDMTRPFALGAYSGALDWYEKETGDDITIPGADEVIGLLGGAELMVKIRTVKSADERYPAAMMRLRRLIAEIPDGPITEQLSLFLERAVLSRLDGLEPDRLRVNLLTMHSTKGLEFSRVYVVGAEDAQLPGGSPSKGPTVQETEEARRLLYVGMTRTMDRLVLTRAARRGEKATGGHQFLDEMGLKPGGAP